MPLLSHLNRRLIAALVVPLALSAGDAALAAAPSGETLLRQVAAGKPCGSFSGDEFERMGEVVMGRMAGSGQAHQAMEDHMRQVMGPGAEQRVHAFFGERFAGCGGQLPRHYGSMMGSIGLGVMMGGRGSMMGGGPGGPGYDGAPGGSFPGYRPGSMMGRYLARNANSDDDEGPSAGAMVGMMLILIAGVALAVYLLRPGRRRSGGQNGGSLGVLNRRLAEGAITTKQYQERKRLLEGG